MTGFVLQPCRLQPPPRNFVSQTNRCPVRRKNKLIVKNNGRQRATLRMQSSDEQAQPRTQPREFVVRDHSKVPGLPGAHFSEAPYLSVDFVLRMITGEAPDVVVSQVLHVLMGWRQLENGEWDDEFVDEEWKSEYKDGPPDFIGQVGNYEPEFDRPIKRANQKLTRSIPLEHKQTLKEVLRPHGFKGWKVNQLTPNRTRRATSVNWILYWYKVHYPDYEWA